MHFAMVLSGFHSIGRVGRHDNFRLFRTMVDVKVLIPDAPLEVSFG
jgi:hypothetical protein